MKEKSDKLQTELCLKNHLVGNSAKDKQQIVINKYS